ncbi:DUF6000 family protein [Actinokineospora bangkokensis]|uniref:Uncharacterized protein n=1 Tax=Actinokineospora bangkokensis TaxID=1193682 RepID=A0A1Q9LEE5_9PSEU|nr:DUF6000 family protein [Actinokineospora bangkokensis]OLR90375.1 hypothetical protein BJP25_27350 [Actinokineospora bangkokensis]
MTGTIERYTVADRYMDLLGMGFFFQGQKWVDFRRALRADGEAITDAELSELFDGGWRERLTATWLVAFGNRTAHRERVGALLLESGVAHAGSGYCGTLAHFGTHRDAELLCAYLDRWLPTGKAYDQDWALSALRHVDATLGTAYATPYVTRAPQTKDRLCDVARACWTIART